MGDLKLETGHYYMDLATGFVYSIRPATTSHTQYAWQCFVHDAKYCDIILVSDLKMRNLELYACTFKDAFERYWQENKQRLVTINRLEMQNYVKPKRKYRKSLGRAF